MCRKNVEIRAEIMKQGLKNYEVGQKLGLTETRFSKMLSEDLTEADRDRIMGAIRDLAGRGETDD